MILSGEFLVLDAIEEFSPVAISSVECADPCSIDQPVVERLFHEPNSIYLRYIFVRILFRQQ